MSGRLVWPVAGPRILAGCGSRRVGVLGYLLLRTSHSTRATAPPTTPRQRTARTKRTSALNMSAPGFGVSARSYRLRRQCHLDTGTRGWAHVGVPSLSARPPGSGLFLGGIGGAPRRTNDLCPQGKVCSALLGTSETGPVPLSTTTPDRQPSRAPAPSRSRGPRRRQPLQRRVVLAVTHAGQTTPCREPAPKSLGSSPSCSMHASRRAGRRALALRRSVPERAGVRAALCAAP